MIYWIKDMRFYDQDGLNIVENKITCIAQVKTAYSERRYWCRFSAELLDDKNKLKRFIVLDIKKMLIGAIWGKSLSMIKRLKKR